MKRRFFVLGAASLPSLASPQIVRAAETPIELGDLYDRYLRFTEYARTLDGTRVSVEGFMAPPIHANLDFYVLTSFPTQICPFCDDESEWDGDILAVYTQRVVDVIPYRQRIVTRGVLQLGSYTHPSLGFVSRVRLMDAVQEAV